LKIISKLLTTILLSSGSLQRKLQLVKAKQKLSAPATTAGGKTFDDHLRSAGGRKTFDDDLTFIHCSYDFMTY